MNVRLSAHAPDDTIRMLLGRRQIYATVNTHEQMEVLSISFRDSVIISHLEPKCSYVIDIYKMDHIASYLVEIY